jgi:hypothetical protein
MAARAFIYASQSGFPLLVGDGQASSEAIEALLLPIAAR